MFRNQDLSAGYLTVALIRISHEDDHLFKYLLAIWIFFLTQCLFKSVLYSSIEMSTFFSYKFVDIFFFCVCILDLSSSLDICIANILFHSLACLFIVLVASLKNRHSWYYHGIVSHFFPLMVLFMIIKIFSLLIF